MLVGSYPLGTFGALPGGCGGGPLGPRVVVLTGLGLMTVSGSSSRSHRDRRPRPGAALPGSGRAATWTAGLAWLGAVVPRERRGEAIGWRSARGSSARSSGPSPGRSPTRSGAGRFSAVAALGSCWRLARHRAGAAGSAGRGASPRLLARDRRSVAAALADVPAIARVRRSRGARAAAARRARRERLRSALVLVSALVEVARRARSPGAPPTAAASARSFGRTLAAAAVACSRSRVGRCSLRRCSSRRRRARAWSPSGSIVRCEPSRSASIRAGRSRSTTSAAAGGVALGAGAGGALGQLAVTAAVGCASALLATTARGRARYAGAAVPDRAGVSGLRSSPGRVPAGAPTVGGLATRPPP